MSRIFRRSLIESHSTTFTPSDSPAEPDIVRLSLSIVDGDFDLGVNELDSPYHQLTLFLENNNALESIIPASREVDGPGKALVIQTTKTGNVATYTLLRKKALQPLPFSCETYFYGYVLAESENIDPDASAITDTLMIDNREMIVLRDTFPFLANENHYNITVDFLVEQGDGTFEEFDFSEQMCTTFDGRFGFATALDVGEIMVDGPFVITRTGKARITLSYSMRSNGFSTLWQGKKIKLRVSVKDRAIHNSNVIETDPILIQ
jgi:hypothetical protein